MSYEEIKKLRVNHHVSQIKLAEKSGFTPAQISSWELKKRIPSDKELAVLTKAMGGIVAAFESGDKSLIKKRVRKDTRLSKKMPSTIQTKRDYVARTEIYAKSGYANYLEKTLCIPNKSANAPKAIALFSGCGGFSLGFDAAGFNIVGHVEIEDSANRIYKENFPNCELLGRDINGVTEAMMDDWLERLGTVDVIIGGPPCQGFSLAGKRNPEDARSQLYQQYVRIVSKIKPKVFVMENVRLLTSMKDSDGNLFIDKIINQFTQASYKVEAHHVNAYEFGVPQTRERVIIIGIRDDENKEYDFRFPAPKYALKPEDSLFAGQRPARTFRDATNDLPDLESGEASSDALHWAVSHPNHVIEWLKNVPEGRSAHENCDPSMRPPSGFNTTYKRIVWDEPCSTISTNFGMISGCRNVHPTSTRSLTVREAIRAQSFPDSFVFVGTWGNVRKAIGNAVPPLMAYEIASSIKSQLFPEGD